MAQPWFNIGGFQTYSPFAIQTANTYGIPTNIFLNQIAEESGYSTSRVSPVGASGIAQIMQSTASSPGYGVSAVDPSDPYASIDFMAQYDAAMYKRTGSWSGALAAYNAGLGNQGAGMSYANDILGGKWDSFITGNTQPGTPSSWTDSIGQWFTDPSQAFGNAQAGLGAIEHALTTGDWSAVSGAATTANQQQTTQATAGLSGIADAFKTAFSADTWTRIPIGALGLVFIVGALIWLAASSKTVQTVAATAAAAA
jgi:hypothetical protein